jgi:hypothetical protein
MQGMFGINDKFAFAPLVGAVAAGTTEVTTIAAMPTKNFDTFTWLVYLGAIVAEGVQSLVVKGSIDGGSNYVALTDQDGNPLTVTVADTDDNKLAVITVVKPKATITHLKLYMNRATQNSALVAVIGMKGNGRSTIPLQAVADVIHDKTYISPKP